MKTFKKIGVGILAAVLAFGATGCKKNDNSDTVVITALEQGYGVVMRFTESASFSGTDFTIR